ncbi:MULTISPECIES: hypothetical protein [Burkholderiaceae]|uniref:hypothetical protein n=1 Tax=Burkholderiaceae TaxID=119060 RepID=UPI001113CCE0|nr:hypothetical protein [Ralstonia sp. 25mfcol4.1]
MKLGKTSDEKKAHFYIGDRVSNGNLRKSDIEKIRDVPHIAIDERYSSVRQKLLSAGWSPYRAPNALPYELDDKCCANRPEVLACSGVGVGPCAWLWKKNGMILIVDTLADVGDELFVGIGQYYGCADPA